MLAGQNILAPSATAVSGGWVAGIGDDYLEQKFARKDALRIWRATCQSGGRRVGRILKLETIGSNLLK